MIERLRRAWEEYWFEPAPLVNLAVCRIIIVGFQLQSLVTMDAGETLAEQVARPDFIYDPLPVLHALIWPFGWTYRPGLEVLEAVYWTAVVAGILGVLGLLTRVSLVVFTVGSVFLQAHAYSFGDFHHPEGVLMIALGALALSPSGRVLSLDAVWRRRRGGTRGADGREEDVLSVKSPYARWPLLLVVWILALAYLSGAFSKIERAGLDWMNGYTLQYYLLQDGLRWDASLGIWLSQQHVLTTVLSWLTMAFEATFFLVILCPVLAVIYVPAGIGMHVGIWVTMKATFLGWVALYAVFVPWDGIGRWLRDRWRRARRPDGLAGTPPGPGSGDRQSTARAPG